MPQKQATSPKKFRIRTEFVELPDMLDDEGNPIVIEVRMVPADKLVPAMKALPTGIVAGADNVSQSLDQLMKWAGPAAEIAKLGDKNGVFSFDGERSDDKFPWDLVTMKSQAEVVNAILNASGWTTEKGAEMTKFRDGVGDGRGDSEQADQAGLAAHSSA